ncbi:MAG: putative heme-binding domain-containing protein, partial [Rhodothermales bacterium]
AATYTFLSGHDNPEVRDLTLALTVKFGDNTVYPQLRAALANSAISPGRRRQALTSLGDSAGAPLLHSLLDGPLQADALRALANSADADSATQILQRYDDFNGGNKSIAIAALSTRADSAKQLLDSVPRQDISAYTARQLIALDDPQVNAKLEEKWGRIRASDKSADSARIKAVLAGEKGDPRAGREIYAQTCAACHRLFGSGGAIGPEITGANRGDIDYLLENILDPSALIGRDYQLSTAEMKDGRLVSGSVVGDSVDTLVLRDATGDSRLPKSEIAALKLLPVSMMPEGLLAGRSDRELRNLFAYLQSPSQAPLPGHDPIHFEGEAFRTTHTGGHPRPQGMGSFKDDKWSADNHLWWTGGKPKDVLTMTITVPTDGSYLIEVILTKARDYGIVQLALDDRPLGERIDLYDTKVTTTGVLGFGNHRLIAGDHSLTATITGTNPTAVASYMFGIDLLRLTPVE